jgi:hypothetical protein
MLLEDFCCTKGLFLRLSCSAQKEKILPDTGQVALVQSLPSTSVHFQLATS